MSSDALNTNPILNFDEDIRDGLMAGSFPIMAACHLQEQRCFDADRSLPGSIDYARKAHTSRRTHLSIEENSKPSYKREVAKDNSSGIFIPLSEFSFFGRRLKQTIARFAKDLNGPETQAELGLSMNEYFTSVLTNDSLPSALRSSLRQNKLGNRGPGLGPTNERRAALALAIIKDHGMIEGFQICGEAGKPIILEKEKKSGPGLDYSRHEEAMAVDIIVKVSSSPCDVYVPLQIKSAGNCSYDQTQRYLTVNAEEKKIVERLIPSTKGLFVSHGCQDGRFRLKIKRRVIKLGLNERKIVKNHKKDFEDDIVNKILTILEYSKEQDEILTLNRPYQKLTYPEKVVAMIRHGFIEPIKDENHELDF